MDIFSTLVLGITEGLSEFLPISSTGHMILVAKLINLAQTDFVKDFEIIIQLGAILAVVLIYFRKVLGNMNLMKNLIVAFIPTAIVGLVLFKFIKGYLLGNPLITVIALVVGGVVMILLEKFYFKQKSGSDQPISYKQSFLIGCFQALSIIPGVSRSAATIYGGMYNGLSRESAVEFSFMLAIPTMFAATGLDLIKSNFHYSNQEWMMLLLGFVTAFITAYFSVKFLLNFVQKHNLSVFGWYRIFIGILYYLLILRN